MRSSTIIALLGVSSAFKLNHNNRPSGVTFFEEGVEDSVVIGGALDL